MRCLLLFVLVFACNSALIDGAFTQVDKPVICTPEPRPSSEPAAGRDWEADCLRRLGDRVVREGSKLTLKLGASKTISFVDNEEECNKKTCSRFRIEGYLPSRQMFVVRESFSESADDIIIDVDGKQTSFAAPLHFPPSLDYAVSVRDSGELMFHDYDIKIVDLKQKQFDIPLFVFGNQQSWRFVRFVDEQHILLETVQGEVEAALYKAVVARDEYGFWSMSRLPN